MYYVSSESDFCLIFVAAIRHEVLCYIGACYITTWQHIWLTIQSTASVLLSHYTIHQCLLNWMLQGVLLQTEISSTFPDHVCIMRHANCMIHFIIPHAQRSCWGGILVSHCLSICPSVHPASCSVAPTVLVGSISYLYILSTNFRRCVECNISCKISKLKFLAFFFLMWITSTSNHGAVGVSQNAGVPVVTQTASNFIRQYSLPKISISQPF